MQQWGDYRKISLTYPLQRRKECGAKRKVRARKNPPTPGGAGGFVAAGGGAGRARAYMRAIIASPNSEHETSLAPSIRRAKS